MAPAAAVSGGRWSETAMLVMDMQKDFVDPAMGSSALLAPGEAIVPSVADAIAVARQRGVFIVWRSCMDIFLIHEISSCALLILPLQEMTTVQVVREHDPFGRDVELFRRHLYSDGKGPAIKGSEGVDMADGLTVEQGDYKVVKTRFSAFFATHLDSVLKTSGIKNLVVVGVQTPNCVRQTVCDAVALDYEKVTVITDATAAATPDIHLSNIRDMKNIGVETPTLAEWRH